MFVYPGDLLRVGTEVEGDLLLVKSNPLYNGTAISGCFICQKIWRVYHLEYTTSATIDTGAMVIIGAVKGVERSLNPLSALIIGG